MGSHRLILRWGVIGALLATVAWTVSGLFAFMFEGANMGPVGSRSWYLIESSDAIAEAGMLVALMGLYARHLPDLGRLVTVGTMVAFTGTAALMLSTVAWVLTERDGGVIDILFTAGALGVLVGFPLLGAGIYRARLMPSWCGLLLMAWLAYFPLIFYLVDFYGEARALFALVWLALAWALRTGRSTSILNARGWASAKVSSNVEMDTAHESI